MHLVLVLIGTHVISFVLGYALRGKVHAGLAAADSEVKKVEGDIKSKL